MKVWCKEGRRVFFESYITSNPYERGPFEGTPKKIRCPSCGRLLTLGRTTDWWDGENFLVMPLHKKNIKNKKPKREPIARNRKGRL